MGLGILLVITTYIWTSGQNQVYNVNVADILFNIQM